MVYATEYALMAANVYGLEPTVKSTLNRLPAPVDWDLVEESNDSSSTGFMAAAYVNNGELVIAFAGTTTENGNDWLSGNVPAATGTGLAEQIFQAAKFYLDLMADPQYAGTTVSFTGHSLGGGVASVMAVLFDKHATVFDEAPFEKSADSSIVVNALKQRLVAEGYTLPAELQAYVPSVDPTGAFIPSPSREAREYQVEHISLKGEVLSPLVSATTNLAAFLVGGLVALVAPALSGFAFTATFGVDKIIGSQVEYDTGAQAILGWDASSVDLHSLTLLVGILQSPAFLSTLQDNPEVLARVFAGLYSQIVPSNATVPSLLELLVRSQTLSQQSGEGALDVLVADIGKLMLAGFTALPGSAALTLKAVLIDAALAGLYEQGDSDILMPMLETLEAVQGGLVLDLTSLGAEAAKVRPELLATVVDLLQARGEQLSDMSNFDRWTFQNGSAGLQVTLGGETADVVIGHTGNDYVLAGGGDDLIFGGDGEDHLDGGSGDDTITGGAGSDTLSGGAGFDTYFGTDGDVINDSDASGRIYLDGHLLTGGAYVATLTTGIQEFAGADGTTYLYDADARTLTASRGGSTLAVEDFAPNVSAVTGGTVLQSGLGLEFFRPTGARSLVILTEGVDTPATMTVASEVYALGGNDTVTGSSASDWLFGGGGNDALKGGAGNDILYGGDGNDTLDGGTGADVLFGGAGDDVLGTPAGVGAGNGSGNFSGYFVAGTQGDTYEGGAGNDTMRGTAMSDLYLFNLGDGHDVITETEAVNAPAGQLDVLRFGAGIAPTDILVSRNGGDLVLAHVNGADQVTVKYWYTVPGATANQIERVEFQDGTTWSSINLTDWALVVTGTAGDDTLTGVGSFNDTLLAGAGNDTLKGGAGNDWLEGGDGNDTLDGGTGADVLFGGAGDDVLGTPAGGGAGNGSGNWSGYFIEGTLGDTYEGGIGNDSMQGTAVGDLYLFNLGDGQDVITETDPARTPDGQVDVLRLGPGIAPSDVLAHRNGTDLVLAHVNGFDKLTIKYWYSSGPAGTAYQIERVEFVDYPNDVLLAPNLTAAGLIVHGTPYGETLTGLASYANTLYGQGGNDTLAGGNLADLLFGGVGNDTLNGGAGNDTYTYFVGDGLDTITDTGGTDTVDLSAVNGSDVHFWKKSLDLYIQVGNGGDGVLVKNQFATGAARADFVIAGGSLFTAAEVSSVAQIWPV